MLLTSLAAVCSACTCLVVNHDQWSPSPQSRPQDVWPERVNEQNYFGYDEKCSIAGVVYDSYFLISNGWAVFDLQGRFAVFEAWIGVVDGYSDGGRFSVSLDGDVVANGTVAPNQKAQKLRIELNGARSIRFDVSTGRIAFADPRFLKQGEASAVGPRPLYPADGDRVKGSGANFTWKPVDGATSYGLELVLMKLKNAAPEPEQRFWGFFTKSHNSLQIDLSRLPPGEYRWAVIAFDRTKVIGKFGPSAKFLKD